MARPKKVVPSATPESLLFKSGVVLGRTPRVVAACGAVAAQHAAGFWSTFASGVRAGFDSK